MSEHTSPEHPPIHLVEGPVGAGKSTFAARLSETHKAPRLNLDEWMVTLFRPDRPATDAMSWYLKRKNRCIEQIWNVACDLLDTGTSAILELGRRSHARPVGGIRKPPSVLALRLPLEPWLSPRATLAAPASTSG